MNAFRKSLIILITIVLGPSVLWAATPPSVKASAAPPQSLSVLAQYFLPAADAYSIPGWGVGKPSSVHWSTPGIIMEDDGKFYGFHRYGQVNGWQVKLFGPRAGVEAIQLVGAFPNSDMKAQLAQRHIDYSVKGCNRVGSLLYLKPMGKRPTYLFYSPTRLTLFTFDETPKPEALKALGIASLQTHQCQ